MYPDVLYLFTHTLRHVQWMLFIGCTFIVCFSYVVMYLLFLYDQETLYLKLKLINLNLLNVTQCKGTLEELKLYLYLQMCI